MIICPNLSNPEVAREFEELKQATSEQAAYHIWSLNNGNAIDRAPNGAPSKLFQTLLEYYSGDRTRAIQAKAKTYGKSFLNWFGDWINDSTNASKVVDENGEPLIVWHGGYLTENNSMPNPTFEEEAYDMWGNPMPGREINPGIWFSTDKEYTTNFSSKQHPVFLNIRHPYRADDLSSTVAANVREMEDTTISEEDLQAQGGKSDGLIGHDAKTWGGATIEEMKNDPRFGGPIPKLSEGIEFAIYDPNQAKSIDNEGPTPYEGTFSRENDDIYYQENSKEVVEFKKEYQYEYNTELKLQETKEFNPFGYFKNRDYVILSEKTSVQFDNYRSKAVKHKKDDRFGFPKQFFDEAAGILYIKSNNYKNSRRYDAVDQKTGEVFKYGITLFTYDEFKKQNYKISKQEPFVPKTFNPKRAINFALLRQMPSKNRYKMLAKQFIYDAIDPKDATINFEIIDRFVDSMPDALWDYISSSVYGFNEDEYIGPFYLGTTDTSGINAETRKINSQHLQINLPKLGLIKLVEQITGLKLLGRKVKFNTRSKKLPNKNRHWGEEVTLDNNLTRPEIEYFIDKILHEEYFKPTSVAENIKHYAQHHNMTVKQVEEVLRRNEDWWDDMYARAQNEHIRHYDWQMVEFKSRIEKEWNNIVIDYLKRRYKNKFTTNDIDYITQYFSGLLPWIKISFNTDSNSGESEPFLRLFSTIHEPFHALHALTYGSDEEIALRNSYIELVKTPFGKQLHNLVKNSLTKNVDEEGLYKETCAYMFQIINTPKELIELGGDEFLSSKIYKLIKDIVELPIETVDKKVTSIQYSEQEKEERVKLTFLQKLYNVIISALHKIIPITKQYVNLIDNVIHVKQQVEIVTEDTITEETERSKQIQQLKNDFLNKLDEFEGAIRSLQSVDNNVLSSVNIDGFFKRSANYNQEASNINDEQIQEELDTQVNLAVQDQLKKDPNTTTEQIMGIKQETTKSWAEQRQSEIIGQTQLRLAQAFGLTRNEDGSWSTDKNDEISKLRLEFVNSLGDHAGHITIDRHSAKAHYTIAIGLLEGDASTFNHELAHYYIHTFWNSKLVQTALKIVYDKKKHGDINTVEGRRAVEEALVDAITERSVDNMFDVKLSQKSFFQSFWETLNQLLYKVFKVRTKAAQNAILDQITASFLVNEQLEQSNREAEIKEIQGMFNQSLIQRMRNKKKPTPTYKQRQVKEIDIAYDPRSLQRSDEKIVQDITSFTQRKERLYSTRSTGVGDSSIYGIADQIAQNQDAVRKVKQQVHTISEAIQANDAQTELHEKSQMFMDFMSRSLEEVNRLNRILDNAEANDYRKTAYIVDLNGEKQYSDASGQISASNPLATVQEFNYDELEYIRDNVLMFIEPVVTAIESLLSEAEQLGYSDEDIRQIKEFLYNTQLGAQITHVLSRYNQATKRKINKWIDNVVDSRDELNDDFKRRLKVNMKSWVSDQMMFGDVNASEIYIGMGSHSKSPIIRAMQDMINDMTDERDELVYQKGLELMDLARKARSAVGFKYKLWGMNFQKLLMQLDKRGLPTGNLLSEYNQGQYYQDLQEFRDKLAFGKNGLEHKLKKILGDEFVLQFDKKNLPIIPENDQAEALAKEYMIKIDDWKCDHADRQFTKKYYRERNEFLSFRAIHAINSVNSKIEDLTRSVTINGQLRLDLLTESQQDELQQYQLERQFLGNIYTPDGILKEEGTIERQIAEEISAWRTKTRNQIKYTVDWSAYNTSYANAKNQQAFEQRFVHYQINPDVYKLLGERGTAITKEIQQLQDQINTLKSYQRNLIDQYKGPSIGQIYWGKLINNGEVLNYDFWAAIKELDEQISDLGQQITDRLEEILEEINEGLPDDKQKTLDDIKAFSGGIPGKYKYDDLFETVYIPYDRTAPDAWTNPNVLTVLAKLKMQVRDRINNDDSIPVSEKSRVINEELQQFEYYNARSDRSMPLSIFSIDKPKVENVVDEQNNIIPLFKRVPSGVFTKLDVNESSPEYVNSKFDSSDGVFEKPNYKYKDKRWKQLMSMPKEVFQLYEAVQKTMRESWEMVPFLGNYDGRMAQITARSGQMIGRQWYKKFGIQGLKNIWNWLKYEFSPMEDDLYYDEHEARERRRDGAINKSIPLRFINKLERPEYITSDVVGSTIAFYNMAQNWRIKSKNLSFFTQLQQRAGVMNAAGITGYQESNQSKVISGIMDRQLYERRTMAMQTVDNISGTFTPRKFVAAVKSIGKIRAAAHLGLLALNLSSAIISFLDPLASLVIDSLTGRYINARDDLYSLYILFANGPLQAFTGGSIKANNKVKAAMQKLHLDGNMASNFQDTDMSQLTRFISDGITMKLFSFGDYTINAMSVVGTMHNYKLYQYADGHKQFLPKRLFIETAMQDRKLSVKKAKSLYNSRKTKHVWECCEVDKKTGEFKAKKDYSEFITDELWKQIRKQTQSRSSIYTGVVGDTERTLLQTDAITAFLTMMRNFLITGIWDRFKSQRDFQVTTFDEDGQASFGDEFADEKDIRTRISTTEARKNQRYYRGGFSFSTRRIENGIYHAGMQFVTQMGPYLSLLIKSSIFRGSKAMNKYTRTEYMKQHDLNETTIYAVERLFLELGLWFILAAVTPITKKAADDNKDDYSLQMLYLLNLRLAVERITYYNPATLAETITTPATAYSDFKRKLKGLDLLLDFTPLGEHDLDDTVKQGNFKGEKRWKYDLFSMLSTFGLYNWYTNMPEIQIGEYNVGGGGAKTIRSKANFYKKFSSWIQKLAPYGQEEEQVKSKKGPKSLYERRQDRLNQRAKQRENRMKQREKRRNR